MSTAWPQLDDNPATKAVVAAGNRLYQLHDSGHIYRFPGVVDVPWELLDDNPATKAIAAAGDKLYQLHNTGRIYRFPGVIGAPWELLDENPATKAIVAAHVPAHIGSGGFDTSTPEQNHLYQLHDSGRIYRFPGVANAPWPLMDESPLTKAIVAFENGLWQLHNTGEVWAFTGVPRTGWQSLDKNPNISALVAGVGQLGPIGLYELETNGTIRELVDVLT